MIKGKPFENTLRISIDQIMSLSAVFLPLFTIGILKSDAKNVGPIMINEYGESIERWVVSTDPEGIIVNGSTIILPHGAQVQIAKNSSFDNTYSPDMYREYILKSTTLSFTVDISSIGCSCNAAFYFSSMPGIAKEGQFNPGPLGNYYCGMQHKYFSTNSHLIQWIIIDANDLDSFCWEMDVMEANKYVLQSTPHSCNAAPGQYIDGCDQSGCCTNSYVVNTMSICPNSSCMINTMHPFRLSVSFNSNTSIQYSLTQNDKSFDFSSCWFISSYLEAMQQAFEYGMVMILSYWGDTWQTMNWLDRMTGCSGDCDTSGHAIFSDIQIS